MSRCLTETQSQRQQWQEKPRGSHRGARLLVSCRVKEVEKGRYGRGKGDAHEAVMGRPALDPQLPQMALFDLKTGLLSNVKYPWSEA